MPARVEMSEQVLNYLLDHLPAGSQILRDLKIGLTEMHRLPDGCYSMDDARGLTGKFWLLVREPGHLVFYGTGTKRGLFLVGSVEGAGVMDIHYQVEPATVPVVTGQIDVYGRVDSGFLRVMTKILLPVLGGYMRNKLAMAVNESRMVAEAIERDRAGVYEKVKDLGHLSPDDLEAYRRRLLP